MLKNLEPNSKKSTLAILCTDYSICFAHRTNNNRLSDNFLIQKLNNDLCTNLIVELNNFVSKKNLEKVSRISVSLGPGNFNATRMIVVLARTISQQINCPLNGFSSFELMAKRIALKNKIFKENQAFWIYKKLKRKGFIAGKYVVNFSDQKNRNLTIKEKVIPRVFDKLKIKESNFPAIYDDEKDLKELLNLSNTKQITNKLNSWEKVLPIYPLSPIN